jgi:hypothetical protein
MAGDVLKLKQPRAQTMAERIAELEDFASTAKPIIAELGELLTLMKASVKLFKTWAPIIALLCGANVLSNGDQAVTNIKDAAGAIASAVQEGP